MSSEKKLRVWHIPQVPGARFFVPVDSIQEAVKVLNTLADYDLFQFEHHIKGDYSNVSGLEVLEGDGWEEWCNDEGEDICDIARNQEID